MSTGYLAPPAKYQPLDNNGNTVPGGKLYTYVSGTTTPLATYADVGLTTPNANPVILDAGGRCTLFIPSGTSYRFSFKTAADALIWTQDDVQATVIASTVSRIIPGTYISVTSTGMGGTGDVTIGLDLSSGLNIASGNLTVTAAVYGGTINATAVPSNAAGDCGLVLYGSLASAGDRWGFRTNTSSAFCLDAYISAAWLNVLQVSSAGILSLLIAGVHNVTAGSSGSVRWDVRNTSAGTGAYAGVTIGNNLSNAIGQLLAYSSTYTTSGHAVADAVALIAATAAGLSIAAVNASGVIRFYAGGTVEKARLATVGANKSSFTLYGSTQVAIALDTRGAIYADATSVRVVGANLAEMAITAAGGWAVATANGVGGTGALALSATGTLSLNGATVSFGANDSGGVGYKVLRVPN